jgi:hypothetical protein
MGDARKLEVLQVRSMWQTCAKVLVKKPEIYGIFDLASFTGLQYPSITGNPKKK